MPSLDSPLPNPNSEVCPEPFGRAQDRFAKRSKVFCSYPSPLLSYVFRFAFISVAVGTALASGPPHGSVREEFPHTALTSGLCDGQSLVGIRMQNARGREPVANQPCHVLPTPAAKLLTAPSQNAKPDAAHLVAEPAQAKTVTRYRMIVEPPPNH